MTLEAPTALFSGDESAGIAPASAEFVNDQSDLGTGFADRHIGISAADEQAMLDVLGYRSTDELIDAAVPASIRNTEPLRLPPATSEAEVAAEIAALAAQNTVAISMLGAGYHPTLTPAVIRRNVLEDPSWYTAYTPYQPEISQGRLEALLNFQTMVSDLTGLPIANASLLDEATAVVEAMLLMRRVSPSSTARVFVDRNTLPQTLEVLAIRSEPVGIELELIDLAQDLPEADAFGVIVSYPGASGEIPDLSDVVEQMHARGGLVAVTTDLLALTLIEAPGHSGADVVVGSSQRLGVPMFYGGPHAAYMAVRDGLERHLPGRLVGVSVDDRGRPAYRLALQTREQHIRRDKATSNICTSQVLLAVVASMYAVYHGPDGLRGIAERIHCQARDLAGRLAAVGYKVVTRRFFDTITVHALGRAWEITTAANSWGLRLRLVDEDHVAVSCSEVTTAEHLQLVVESFLAATHEDEKEVGLDVAEPAVDALEAIHRNTPYLTHPVFHEHRSETAMLRYLRRLSDRDYALDRGMIPLGSCTMKLNATTEMEAIGLAGFADLHPFAPSIDAEGYRVMIEQLESWLAQVTGYAAVSVQPNAGSQGELAGLLAIRAYHRERGDHGRNVCLIPASAHGTNAASAVLAGMRVVVVRSCEDGTVDLEDLESKCREHSDDLAAVMVTYPSTHGVYEEGITALCDLVHAHGGQVYVDGANLNALLGVARPGAFGGDVSHLNLHKTFCIPHGGGGPGVGPVAVAAHLAPYLPGHEQHPDPQRRLAVGAISAAPYGSPGILPISWAYVRMMGAEGLTRATHVAVLSANYLAARLSPHFPVLYVGDNGLVAHECILDLRDLTDRTGVTVEDVAKRLIDYGFHAPTMSFPVAGTLMVEPTESENLAELDRFVAAMVSIRAEIDEIASGSLRVEESALRGAPHPAQVVIGPWDRAYSREHAAYPGGVLVDKYWPPVGRVQQAHGDRNLVCACPPPEAFEN